MARAIYDELGKSTNVTYLVHDNYYKHNPHLTLHERSRCNYDHPNSLDTALLVENLRDLKAGRTVQVPNYDFNTHLRKPNFTTTEPKSIILVEGILIFTDPDLVKEIDVKVFIVS